MLTGISAGTGIHVSGAWSSLPYVTADDPAYNSGRQSGDPIQGAIRIRGSNLEAYNFGVWQMIPSSAQHIELDQRTQAILDWAETKMEQDRAFKAIAERHPAIAELKSQLDMMVLLAGEHKE